MSGWMIDDRVKWEVASRARELGVPNQLTSASECLGAITLSSGEQVKAWVVHAVDSVITDGESVVVINRVHPPGQGLPALPGGFLDNLEGGGVETPLQAAIREPLEEAGVQITGGREAGVRNMYRPHDVRQATRDLPSMGISKGDVFMVSTQAIRFDVPTQTFDTLHAGDDAEPASARALKISEIGPNTFGIPDHFNSLEEALKLPALTTNTYS